MDGVLVVDKPRGLTSHDVVAAARRHLCERRVGHTGTLDPLATGVLALVCGRATRLARFLSAADKAYEARIVFGFTTDTWDVTGTETTRSDEAPEPAVLERALAAFTGEILQTPPAHSAKKVGGQRAYALARRQVDVALPPVPVRVSRLELLEFGDARARVAIECSAGFYVRALAHDLGQRVGTGACLAELRRTRSGQFSLDDSVSMEDLAGDAAAARLVPLPALLPSMAAVRLDAGGRRRVSHGQALTGAHVMASTGGGPPGPSRSSPADAGAWVRLLDETGDDLLALAWRDPATGALHPRIVLT